VQVLYMRTGVTDRYPTHRKLPIRVQLQASNYHTHTTLSNLYAGEEWRRGSRGHVMHPIADP
jgi:hypothetical protein